MSILGINYDFFHRRTTLVIAILDQFIQQIEACL